MKKVILATMALTFTAISSANASENTRNAVEDTLKVTTHSGDTLQATTPVEDTIRHAAQQVERKAVPIADLPSGVKTALAGEQFTGWRADRAFWVTGNTVDGVSNGKGAAGNTNIRSAKNATEGMESPTGTTGTNGTVTNGSTTATGRTKEGTGTTGTTGTNNAQNNANGNSVTGNTGAEGTTNSGTGVNNTIGSGEGTNNTTGNSATGTSSKVGTGTAANHNGYYEVELSRNTDTKTVRFDKEGGELK